MIASRRPAETARRPDHQAARRSRFFGAASGGSWSLKPDTDKGPIAIRDLIPWSRQENRLPTSVSAEQGDRDEHPILSLHHEMNWLFDEVFRGLGVPSLAGGRSLAWPHVELAETDKDIRVIAELPGLDEKDVDISLEEGVLTLRGEKRSEVEDRDRGYRSAAMAVSNGASVCPRASIATERTRRSVTACSP